MYRPEGHKIRCDYIHCSAGLGLAGLGICLRDGIWWHSACPAFKSEEQYLKEWGERICAQCGKQYLAKYFTANQ